MLAALTENGMRNWTGTSVKQCQRPPKPLRFDIKVGHGVKRDVEETTHKK